MEAFTRLTARALPFPRANVDTDQIIPARFLGKALPDFARWAFHDLRYDENGTPKPDFPLNDETFRGAKILVARDNFGCGSSREHAVWTLMNAPDTTRDFSFRCVIAPSFGDIFRSNACKNGLLPVILPSSVVENILQQVTSEPHRELTVDLEQQMIFAPDGTEHRFDFDAFQKECLIRGVDDIEITMELEHEIVAFERKRAAELPWLFSGTKA